MLEKIFGKRKSIQRSLVISFIIAIIAVSVLAIIEFIIFVDSDMNDTVIKINIQSEEDLSELINIARRMLIFGILNVVLISGILIQINLKKLLQPMKKINEATKKVAKGDYDIELETTRVDEIGELTENFNKMTKGLQSTENLQKEFINNVSHEIKTPISSIEGFAKLLKNKDISDEEREEYSNIIIEESERLANLAGKMLKLAKLHNQDRIVNVQEVLVSEQIRKAVALLEPKWAEKELKINVSLEENVIFLGDEELIFQVWINLIENAIKFSNKNGKIDIKVYKQNNYINVEIKDYGIGMKEDEIEKAFERFYQIDKSHSEEGSGLRACHCKKNY